MKCPKCEGLMYMAGLSDYFMVFYAWKCVNCGAVMDHTILRNRYNSTSDMVWGTERRHK